MGDRTMKRRTDGKNGIPRAANALELSALAAVLIAALALCYTSLTTTNYINPYHYQAQQIASRTDSLLFNLILTAGILIVMRVLRLVRIPRWFVKAASALLLTALAAVGIAWSLMMRATPISDQGILLNSAMTMWTGDRSILSNPTTYEHFYFVRFPFQIGYLSVLELCVRLFGEMQTMVLVPIFNTLLLVSSYAALLMTTDRLFGDARVTLLTLFWLCLCPQPLFACAWMYGLIPALACTLWSVYFALRYMKDGKIRFAALAAGCSALAVYLKPNAWIGAAAIAIVFVLQAIRTRGWKPLLAAALLLAACYPLPKAAQALYEKRIGTEFGEGYPMSSWMAMGMQESWMASGWYNGYSQEMYKTYGTDLDAIRARNKTDIENSVRSFVEDPQMTYLFYQDKFASQWNESTFESLWIAIVGNPYGQEERPILARSLYDGRWPGILLEKEMNYSLQAMYAGFALGLVVMLRKRESGQLLFPLIILGGILFHLLFEANSKYALTYLPMFAPVAAYGTLMFGVNARQWFVKSEYPGGKEDA